MMKYHTKELFAVSNAAGETNQDLKPQTFRLKTKDQRVLKYVRFTDKSQLEVFITITNVFELCSYGMKIR